MSSGPTRRTTSRWVAAVVVPLVLLSMTAVTSSASAQAEPFDIRIGPDSGSQYLEPGATYADLWHCITEPAFVTIVVRDASGNLVRTVWDEIFWSEPLCADGYISPQWNPLTNDGGQGVPSGVYTVEISARTEAGATDVETFQLGVVREQFVGSFEVPDVIRGQFEMVVDLSPWFVEIANVTNITLKCYTDGVPSTIGSIDQVPPDGQAVVPGDSAPCPIGENNLLDCDLTWVDPFGVSHARDCDQRVTFAQPFPASFEIGLVDNYAQPEEYVFHEDERAGRLEFCLSRPGIVDAVVRSSTGAVVRTLAADQSFPQSPCDSNPPVSELVWDFRDDDGTLVPDGDYTIEMSAVDTSDPPETATLTLTWHVSSLTPGEFVSPVPGQFVAGPETYEFHPTPGFTDLFGQVAIGTPCARVSPTFHRQATIPSSAPGTPSSAGTRPGTSSSPSSSSIHWGRSTSTAPSSASRSSIRVSIRAAAPSLKETQAASQSRCLSPCRHRRSRRCVPAGGPSMAPPRRALTSWRWRAAPSCSRPERRARPFRHHRGSG